ncbi:MAG: SH3 domain-containing protein, partial [Bacteroidota bacterium]
MIKPSPLYRRPDLMTLRNDTLKAGEIVAVIERQGDWLHVSGRNKDKKGWIQVGNNVSLREKDVYIALLWYKARTSKRRLRPGKVANVLHDPAIAGSLLKDLVETDYNQNYKALLETEEADVPSEDESDPSPVDSVSASATSGAEQLLITDQNVRVHSSPDSQTDNIVTELEEGTVCVVLARGQRAEVAETEDYWYKVDHQGQEGWVFGHYTSKRVLR